MAKGTKNGDWERTNPEVDAEALQNKLGGEEYEAVKHCLESQSMQFKQQVRELHLLSRRQFNILSPFIFNHKQLDEREEDMTVSASKDSGAQLQATPSQQFKNAIVQTSTAKVNLNWWQDPMKVFGMHSPPLVTTSMKDGSLSSSRMESTVQDSSHPSLYSSGLVRQGSMHKHAKRGRDSSEDSFIGLEQPACPAPKKATPQSAAGILLALSETPCQSNRKKSKSK